MHTHTHTRVVHTCALMVMLCLSPHSHAKRLSHHGSPTDVRDRARLRRGRWAGPQGPDGGRGGRGTGRATVRAAGGGRWGWPRGRALGDAGLRAQGFLSQGLHLSALMGQLIAR